MLKTAEQVVNLLITLDSSKICIENPEQMFVEISSQHMDCNTSGELNTN